MIGKRLRDARLAKGWTQKGLSEMSEVSFEQISRYETGRINPHSYVLAKLAKVLDVSTDYLEGLDYEMPNNIQNEFQVDDHTLNELVEKIKTTSFSSKDKILLKGFLDLLFMRKAVDQLVSKNDH